MVHTIALLCKRFNAWNGLQRNGNLVISFSENYDFKCFKTLKYLIRNGRFNINIYIQTENPLLERNKNFKRKWGNIIES